MPELDPVGSGTPDDEGAPEPVVVPIVGYRYERDAEGNVLLDDEGNEVGEPVTEKFTFRGMTSVGALMQTARLTRGGVNRAEVGRRAYDALLDWVLEDDLDAFIDYCSECVSGETFGLVARTLIQHYTKGPTTQRSGSRRTPTGRGATSPAAASAKGSLSNHSRSTKGSPSSSRTGSTTSRPGATKRATRSRSGSASRSTQGKQSG